MGLDNIAVTGMGCLCAAGGGVKECADAILNGKRNLSYDQGVRTSRGITYPVFPIARKDLPENYDKLPETMRCGALALKAAVEALEMSGLSSVSLRHRKVGVCIGTTAGNSLNNDPFYPAYRDGECPGVEPILEYRRANPASYVARALAVDGPAMTVSNACSSGAIAIIQAFEWLDAGVCDIVIAGGAEKLCPVVCNGFASLLIADSEACKPFDKGRNGLNLGEGAGMLVLERAESVNRREASCLGRITGTGNRCDAYHLSAPDPKGAGLKLAVADALKMAGITEDDLAFIHAHGTGTQENDAMEGTVFGEVLPRIPYFSVKGCTGHTLGASGGIEAVLTLAFLNRGKIPASVGFTESDPTFVGDPLHVNSDIIGHYAMSDSIAFGGNCGVLIFQGVER